MVARYGGEEFAVILPETDNRGAVVFAEKIRKAIASAAFHVAEPGDVTVSVGVATYPFDAQEPGALVEVADERLYRAKAEGRNRVQGASRTE